MKKNSRQDSHQMESLSGRCRSDNGFTLVELVVVMILVSMLSGLLIYSVRGHVDVATIERAVQKFASLDRRLRSETRKHEQRADLRLQNSGRRISIKSNINLAAAGINMLQSLPNSVAIDSLQLARASGGNTLPINARGQSPNYAVRFSTQSGAETWLVTLGISGQQLRCQTEAEADALLRP